MLFGTADIPIGIVPWYVTAVHAAETKEVQHSEKVKDQEGPQAPRVQSVAERDSPRGEHIQAQRQGSAQRSEGIIA